MSVICITAERRRRSQTGRALTFDTDNIISSFGLSSEQSTTERIPGFRKIVSSLVLNWSVYLGLVYSVHTF